MKKISILGSTGSVGQTTLDIVSDYPDQFKVVGLAAGKNMSTLIKQIKEFQPEVVSVQDETSRNILLDAGVNIEIGVDQEGACMVAALAPADVVVSAIVGAAGLKPTFAAIHAGKTILLANKESMVISGALMCQKAQSHQARILPIDSEHSAIFQCLQSHPNKEANAHIQKVILTASGGPFFFKENLDFNTITVEQALKHPNWSMGPKITIDSATMMNKALEIIEAKWLFDLAPKQIDVLVHPQSIIHSMVEFVDGSALSQMGIPDMRGPIGYALAYPERLPQLVKSADLAQIQNLSFFKPDHGRYPSIPLAFNALEASPTHPAVFNGANEMCVQAFLDQTINFNHIFSILDQTLSSYSGGPSDNLEDFVDANNWGCQKAKQEIEKCINSTYK